MNVKKWLLSISIISYFLKLLFLTSENDFIDVLVIFSKLTGFIVDYLKLIKWDEGKRLNIPLKKQLNLYFKNFCKLFEHVK